MWAAQLPMTVPFAKKIPEMAQRARRLARTSVIGEQIRSGGGSLQFDRLVFDNQARGQERCGINDTSHRIVSAERTNVSDRKLWSSVSCPRSWTSSWLPHRGSVLRNLRLPCHEGLL
jgi:hypothetical protein